MKTAHARKTTKKSSPRPKNIIDKILDSRVSSPHDDASSVSTAPQKEQTMLNQFTFARASKFGDLLYRDPNRRGTIKVSKSLVASPENPPQTLAELETRLSAPGATGRSVSPEKLEKMQKAAEKAQLRAQKAADRLQKMQARVNQAQGEPVTA